MTEGAPLVEPEEEDWGERAKDVPAAVAEGVGGGGFAVALDEAVGEEPEEEDDAAVVKEDGGSAGESAEEEPGSDGATVAIAFGGGGGVPHGEEAEEGDVSEHEVVVEEAGAHEDWGSEGVEESEE